MEFLKIGSKKIEIQWCNVEITNRPTLVFMHEGLGCAGMWKDFPKRLSDSTGCPSFVFSRFGYGNSDPSSLPWKINFMHTQALELLPQILKQAGIKKYIFIGHSDGGSIGIISAGRTNTKGLKGLITLSAHVFCEQYSVDSIQQAKINYEQKDLKKALQKYHGKNTDNAFRGWNNAWLNPNFMNWNIEKYLKKIKVPMLAVQGKDDQYGTGEQIASIKSKVNNIESLLLDNCRHSPHLDQPETVLKIMTKFINQIAEQYSNVFLK
ncbi:MAG: alpha/beta hydrolase [Desulfobacteraceae bacterium]|nr:alpha/beta hydrolase [Desulfobacteraceae bacterium]